MNLNQAKTQSTNENQVARENARARRMRRRHQNHSYLSNSSRSPSLFTLRW
jgi:hypothetical protein